MRLFQLSFPQPFYLVEFGLYWLFLYHIELIPKKLYEYKWFVWFYSLVLVRSEKMRNFKDLKIAVAGTGYVGLSLATLLAQHHQGYLVEVCKHPLVVDEFPAGGKVPHGQIDLFLRHQNWRPKDICLPFIPVLAGLQVPERIRCPRRVFLGTGRPHSVAFHLE